MKRTYYRTIGQSKLTIINKKAKGSWIDIQNPTSDEIKSIAEQFNLDSEDLEDILDSNEIPKVERIGDTLLVILKVPNSDNNKESLDNFSVLINDDCILTISAQKNLVIDKILLKPKKIFTSQRSKLFLLLLQGLAYEYLIDIEKIRRKIESLKRNIDNINDTQIIQMVKFEESLNNYNLALQPTKYILSKIKAGKMISVYANDEDMLQDMYEDFNQAAEICLLNLKSIVTLRDSYKILMDLSLNKTIKLLTSVTVILTIPTIVSGLFGMNVELPVAGGLDGFYTILAITAVGIVGLVLIFIWKKWL